MAFCTFKTKSVVNAIHNLPVATPETITAIEYEDKQLEVYCLGRDYVPVTCEDVLAVLSLTLETQTIIVIVDQIKEVEEDEQIIKLRISFWSAVSPLGFSPKDVTCDGADKNISLDGKSKMLLKIPYNSSQESSLPKVKAASLNHIFCISFNSEIIWFFTSKLENSSVNISQMQTIQLDGIKDMKSMILFKHEDSTACLAYHQNGFNYYNAATNEEFKECIPGFIKLFPSNIAAVCKIDDSRFLLLTSNRDLYAFKSPNTITKVPVPDIGSTCAYISVGLSPSGQGTVALCHQNHSIYLFDLNDIYLSVDTINTLYPLPPLKVLFSKNSINAICMTDYQTLIASSSTSHTLTTWVKII